MMNLFRRATCLLVLALLAAAFAEEWYVCLGSFREWQNAEERVQLLAANGVSGFIQEHAAASREVYYRVLLAEPFTQQDCAYRRRDELAALPWVKQRHLDDLWVCQMDVRKAPPARQVVEEAFAPAAQPASREEPLELEAVAAKPPLPPPVLEPVRDLEPEPVAPVPAQTQKPAVTAILPPEEPPATVHQEQAPMLADIQLAANDEGLPVSPDAPYSVLVRSYKDELNAIHDCDRLKQENVDAYILKKYEDGYLFTFDVHAGAFATPEEGEALREELREQGITDAQVADFNEYSSKLADYDNVVQSQKVTFNSGSSSIPQSLAKPVQDCLRHFPVNLDFQIEFIEIYDFDAITAKHADITVSKAVASYLGDTTAVHAAAFALYQDVLFAKEVSIFVAQAGQRSFTSAKNGFASAAASMPDAIETALAVVPTPIQCTLIQEDGRLLLAGTNADDSIYIRAEATGFTPEEFSAFLRDSYSGGSLMAYPQLRKTLFILPDTNTARRNFLTFNLSRVQKTYVEQRSFAQWSIPMMGHWCANATFFQNGTEITVAFFDLDYDYNAKYNHQLFIADRNGRAIDSANHSETLKGHEAWYTEGDLNELSFTAKSYIVAIDSYDLAKASFPVLKSMAEDLRIWDESSAPLQEGGHD